MPIIYEPDPKYFDLRHAIQSPILRGVQSAATVGAVDLLTQVERDKPWAFYGGVLLGGAAIATGIPYAAATLYVVGELLDVSLFKSPASSNLRVFLNGVQYASLETFASTQVWEAFQVVLQNGLNRVDFVADDVGANNAGTDPVTALGDITVTGGSETLYERAADFVWSLTVTISDEKGKKASTRQYIAYEPVADARYDVIEFVNSYLWYLDQIITGRIESANLTLSIKPKGVKPYPLAGADVEHGADMAWRVNFAPNWRHTIPTVNENLFTPSGNLLLGEPDLYNFIQFVEEPHQEEEAWELQFTDARGDALFKFSTGNESFKRSR